ncbi:MAG: HD domain-containing protein [Brevinematales bacterium]|nr:HD domain-containing protein [Brevinematales bacterium]
MITRRLIERIHQGAYIRRWNDHIRPDQGFSELDKQAHKMMIAFFLAKIEEHIYQRPLDYQKLIEGGISQYFHRVELTDIKPPIFHRLMEKQGEALNAYVIKQCEQDLTPIGKNKEKETDFFSRFCDHLKEDLKEPSSRSLEHQILGAAHYLATKWEFDLIYPSNRLLYGIKETKTQIEKKLIDYKKMPSVSYATTHGKYKQLFNLIGQLRFQRRWTQTVRIPETSVMGHSLVVAMLAYLVSLERGMDISQQAIHHFWLGLFHDIPEVLTRDIISPVKQSVEELEKLIKEIEKEELQQKVSSLFQKKNRIIGNDFLWYIETEFSNIPYKGSPFPLSGEMVKHCDLYAAYVEASLSLAHGVTSRPLTQARHRIEEKLSQISYDGFLWQPLLEYFA